MGRTQGTISPPAGCLPWAADCQALCSSHATVRLLSEESESGAGLIAHNGVLAFQSQQKMKIRKKLSHERYNGKRFRHSQETSFKKLVRHYTPMSFSDYGFYFFFSFLPKEIVKHEISPNSTLNKFYSIYWKQALQ